MPERLNLIEAARLTVTLLEDLEAGGAENPELAILKDALAATDLKPPKGDTDNNYRAKAARVALDIYGVNNGDTDTEALIADLIADLGHLADTRNADFVTLVKRGLRDWCAEKDVPDDPNQIHLLRPIHIDIGESETWSAVAVAQPSEDVT